MQLALAERFAERLLDLQPRILFLLYFDLTEIFLYIFDIYMYIFETWLCNILFLCAAKLLFPIKSADTFPDHWDPEWSICCVNGFPELFIAALLKKERGASKGQLTHTLSRLHSSYFSIEMMMGEVSATSMILMVVF